jgi:UDP-glucose 4-epimerase
MKNILVVGGAGYIGAHMVAHLNEQGYNPIVLDDLSSGHRAHIFDTTFIEGNCGDASLLDDVFTTHTISAVMHFASFIQVGESVTEPSKYYHNNVTNTLTLLDAMVKNKIDTFIFSSTAATYGNPVTDIIDETHPTEPINPYGRTKLMIEQALRDYHAAYGLKFGCLRYFNASGAHPSLPIGEAHEPETHLIPLILQTASGKREQISIFGDDYNTPDGTCLRDYIHVCDLADAHLKLYEYLADGGESTSFNLGTGIGYSVKQVIDEAARITALPINIHQAPRRAGDPERLIADGSKASAALGWKPQYSDLTSIIKDAWAWEQSR